jgi:hypothetical protein
VNSLKDRSSAYFEHYHEECIEVLKMMLENETWQLCPLPPHFSVSTMRELQGTKSVGGLGDDATCRYVAPSVCAAQRTSLNSVSLKEDYEDGDSLPFSGKLLLLMPSSCTLP